MIKRILTAAVAIPIVVLMLWLHNFIVTLAAMTLVCVLAVGEVLLATKYFSNRGIAAVCMIFVAVMPSFVCSDVLYPYVPVLAFVFLLTMFLIMLSDHENVKFQETALVSFVSFLVPLSISTIVLLQEKYEHGVYYMILVLLIPWISDAGAYFVGSAFGKHKMAPKISPKKSWEGFFGGLATAIISVLVVGFGYPWWVETVLNGTVSFTVNIPLLVLLAVVGTVFGVIGDFSASLLKRQCMVKDFGSILPGHGGIMDRFDSVLFVAPFFYLVFKFIEPVTKIIA